jgi:hypothetical protein
MKRITLFILLTNTFTCTFAQYLKSDRQNQMKEFLKSNELNVRKEAGFKLAISYYNYISSPAFSKKISI